MACVVCKLGDDCGPMQRTDCCDQPFHWNSSCARALGIRVRRGGPTGDLRCVPQWQWQCAPCEDEGEDTGEPKCEDACGYAVPKDEDASKKRALVESREGSALLQLPNDVFVLIMASLVHLHACPKPLLRLLLTTKQLCTPHGEMFQTVVNFMSDYNSYLSHMHTHFSDKSHKEVDKFVNLGSTYVPYSLTNMHMLSHKCTQLHEHDLLTDQFLLHARLAGLFPERSWRR